MYSIHQFFGDFFKMLINSLFKRIPLHLFYRYKSIAIEFMSSLYSYVLHLFELILIEIL